MSQEKHAELVTYHRAFTPISFHNLIMACRMSATPPPESQCKRLTFEAE